LDDDPQGEISAAEDVVAAPDPIEPEPEALQEPDEVGEVEVANSAAPGSR
jgi:hypothetical protein